MIENVTNSCLIRSGPILRRSAVGKGSPKTEPQQPSKKMSQSDITDDVPQGIFIFLLLQYVFVGVYIEK